MLYENTSDEPVSVPTGPIAPGEKRDLPPPAVLRRGTPFRAAFEAYQDGRLVPA